MPSFTGLIGSVLKGASEPYVEAAAGELKNQQRASLESQLSDILYQRDQRIKEADTMRARTEEERKLSPEYLEKVGTATLKGSQIALKNREALASESGRVSAIETTAGLPAKDIEAQGVTGRKLTETKTLAGDTGYVEGVKKLDEATSAGEIAAAKERSRLRLEGGGGGSSKEPAIVKVETGADGNSYGILKYPDANGNRKINLGPSASFDKNVAGIITKLQKEDNKFEGTSFSKLPIVKQREIATELLTGKKISGDSAAPASNAGGGNVPAGGGGYAKGDTRVIESGEHKGKTAVFDGAGWKLK